MQLSVPPEHYTTTTTDSNSHQLRKEEGKDMETRKSKELRVHLRRIKPSATGRLRPNLPSVSGKTTLSTSSSDSESDDFATVHFKLAAALEAAAAHASGLSFDWQTMKSTLLSEAKSVFKAKETNAEVTTSTAKKSMLEQSDDSVHEPPCTPISNVASTPTVVRAETTKRATTVHKRHKLVESNDDDNTTSSSSSYSGSHNDDFVVPGILLAAPESIVDNDVDNTMQLARLMPYSETGVSVADDANPTEALSKILAMPPFDAEAKQLQVQLVIKPIVSLAQLSLRENNEIEVEIKKSSIMELKNKKTLSPFMDFSHIHVKHNNEEFYTFCSCKNCVEYREIVIHVMVEQFKASHMEVMLLDVLIKAYGPMLKNVTAYNKFEKLLDENKSIYWITCGYVYHKKAEHMDFIYDNSLSDKMIFVLFSSILMVNNPLLLLQILSFNVECIVKAYAEGFLEIVEPDNNRIPAEEMLTYIIDGYDDLCRISDQISCYLFAFENDFLSKFSLTWKLLCQRLYQQHVYANLTDTMLACIITLKEEELTTRRVALIKKYIQFDDKMNFVEKRWPDVWMQLNKFNLSETERKRRKCLSDVYCIFDTLVQDAIAFSLQESGDDNDFYDFQSLDDRRLAWQNIMAYTRMKWPDGFFEPPNTLVCDDKCKKCNILLEYHLENCKCITCSIGGGPPTPRHNGNGMCYKCLAHSLVEKDVNFYESKILNVCATDDFLSFVRTNRQHKNTTLAELGAEVSASMNIDEKSDTTIGPGEYHVAWALFHHLNDRKPYKLETIDRQYFCNNCKLLPCQLSQKILNNEISKTLSQHLVNHYQPLYMSREELRSILPNIMLYNRKMITSNIFLDLADVHDLVVKIYWTFIMSIYATYFITFDDENSLLNLSNFELQNNDIFLCTDKIVGNDDDTKFVEFLDKIKSLSPFKNEVESDLAFTVDVHAEEIQNKLDNILNIEKHNKNQCPPSNEKLRSPTNEAVESPIPSAATAAGGAAADGLPKKTCKERSKKCCFDHSDLGDHCKENHTNKKRIKKECNHTRMNETRDRLRKKLSQLVSARKNLKASDAIDEQASLVAGSTTNSSAKIEDEDDSLECLSTLCKRISHLNTSTKMSGKSATTSKQLSAQKKTPNPATTIKQKLNNNNNNNSSNSNKVNLPKESNAATISSGVSGNGENVKQHSIDASNGATASKRGSNSLDMVSEIYEFLDNYSKDQSKVKKWISETLSFIEGSDGSGAGGGGGGGGNGSSGGKRQPQPTNPKKAAKKAKQKQRKEEEKRIAELQDYRAQFHDIYFKEFVDKHQLKSLKASKKRDKKKIIDLETNVKKLQRAKAKVETSILELIATVKQTNTEFKFTYLPTKEQQLEKLKEIDAANAHPVTTGTGTNGAIDAMHVQQNDAMISNNLNMPSMDASTYSLPYAHANHFPYHIDFQGQSAGINNGTAYGMMRPAAQLSSPTPVCYAPPQHQQLSPDVVAAMAANAATCSMNTDPSKRIVTIRRVNLPNVPEPQVTVTAKGISPDKDKLLYTFVNGQLVQTGTATPSPPPQLPMTQLPLNHSVSLPPIGSIAEQLMSIPRQPALSKTQMKKERRRLAKLAAEEAKAFAEAEEIRRQEHERELKQQREKEALAQAAKAKAKDKKKKETVLEHSAALSSQKKKKLRSSNIASNPNKTNMQPKQRSASTTTSCSVETSLSATPISSEVNTRDNSVASVKPMVCGGKKKEPALMEKSKQLLQEKKSKLQSAQSTKTKTLTATSLPQQPPPPAAPQIIHREEALDAKKKERLKRPKFIDNGQFDNNPFKSLHMQDSESDYHSGSSGDEEEMITVVEQVVQRVESNIVPQQQATPKAAKSIKSKNEQTKMELPTKLQPDNKRLQHQELRRSEADAKAGGNRQKLDSSSVNLKTEVQMKKNSRAGGGGGANATANANKSVAKEVPLPQMRSSKQHQQQQQQIQEKQNKQQQQQQQRQQQQGERAKNDQRQQSISNKRNNTLRYDCSGGGGGGGSGTINPIETTMKPQQTSSSTPHNNHQRHANNRNSSRTSSDQVAAAVNADGGGKPLSKRAQKQAQRNKKFQQNKSQQHHNNSMHYDDCCAGIPNNMGYFNPDEVMIPPSPQHQQPSQNAPPHKRQQMQHAHHHHNNNNNHHHHHHLHQQYSNLTQQMQELHIGGSSAAGNGAHLQQRATTNVPNYDGGIAMQNFATMNKSMSANVSIMDQLNRGVQVENLSLPPGITLTKVDPIKSEQLRQKSESIKKLSKPLQPQSAVPQAFHHPGATIIAPPIASVSGYAYGATTTAPYATEQNGIIMVEANPPAVGKPQMMNKAAAVAAAAAAATASGGAGGKTSKNKKRRNKTKPDGAARSGNNANNNNNNNNASNAATATGSGTNNAANNQPKMITLRNPMFHSGPAGAAAAILQQPGIIPTRPLGGLTLPTTLPLDQPAAIIKNDNGMFTIRNPALHQAVTNGLALGGYRQFGNVNYYTPQEAAAEAARATQQQNMMSTAAATAAAAAATVTTPANRTNGGGGGGGDIPASFSYFSNSPSTELQMVSSSTSSSSTSAASMHHTTHNTISISCTSIDGNDNNNMGGGGLRGDAAVIARPSPPQKCISAIGSEIKNAQQQKQKSKESQWKNFVPNMTGDNCNVTADNPALQEKYQQSSYYNGFDVYTAAAATAAAAAAAAASVASAGTKGPTNNVMGPLFVDSGVNCHMHHSCGDDSPPPTITGFNSYLEGIPNTGIIRYDDASFLKNLIPGQNLNNEVSIHNINDSNYQRNAANSPVAHRVEITPVYAQRLTPTPAHMYDHCVNSAAVVEQQQQQQQQQKFIGNSMNNYRSDITMFSSNNCGGGGGGAGGVTDGDIESFKGFNNYDYERSAAANEAKQKVILNLNELLLKKGTSQRSSPSYLDDASTLENFVVQNMSTLQISSAVSTDEQCNLQVASSSGGSTSAATTNTSNATTTNGWW